jgi:hypothetical protein
MPRARSVVCALILTGLLGAVLSLHSPGSAAQGRENKIPDPVREALDEGKTFTLLSLQPTRVGGNQGFQGWTVLGKKEIKTKTARKRTITALAKGAAEKGLAPARCFIPRHGIQVTHKGKTVDLVICFECYQVQVYTDGQQGGDFLIGRSPQPVLDKILRDAGVPLAPR